MKFFSAWNLYTSRGPNTPKYACVGMYIYICVCVHTYIHTYIYICMYYTHINININNMSSASGLLLLIQCMYDNTKNAKKS